MAMNELFRLLSLRQARPLQGDVSSGARPRSERKPDPRLRHARILEEQAKVKVSHLVELKRQHVAAAKRIIDLEAVQRAVVKTAGLEASPRVGETPTPVAKRLQKQVEGRLTGPQIGLFRGAIKDLGETADLDDVLTGLRVDLHIFDANSLCTQIRAIEEDLSERLPTVQASAGQERPFVVAAGPGDLVVARETLVGYTAREIAHIENILPGETKLREHSRLSRSEEVVESETVSEKESEKDSQTTDRYELQAEAQATINRDFSVKAGVNVSTRYGIAKVNASLDTAFSQSESQSRSSSIETAREIVTKAVERTFERVRKLRRLTITEEIRELNRHEIVNLDGAAPAAAVSGMYLWVEKIQRIELRHYGKRMMVEFHIPEPAISLLEQPSQRKVKRRLPPFDVGPPDVQPGNYMCLAERFGAFDVQPPPPQILSVGWSWVSALNEEGEQFGEAQFSDTINVPGGYRPLGAHAVWSGLKGKNDNQEFNFAFAVGGASEGKEYTNFTPAGPVNLPLPFGPWPQGVPVSGRLHGAWDGAMHFQVRLNCERTPEAMAEWQLRTWEALRAGYEALERKLAQEEQRVAIERDLLGPRILGGPEAENRRIERGELQKWAVKSMRGVAQNFNAIEAVGGRQEMSPVRAEAEAPIVRFYEDAFEWEHMSYFLYPYHWARRESWPMRMAAEATDPQFKAFLAAGAARVIVPVTPGYEAKVMTVLDSRNDADELVRVLATPRDTPPAQGEPFRDLWIELLTERDGDAARGSGTLAVERDSAEVRISQDSLWDADSKRDLGREVLIDGEPYLIAEVIEARRLRLDRPYEGKTDPAASYATGSMPYGPPWTVRVPTTLVVLADKLPELSAIGGADG